jgi:hypothetical protein
LLLAAVPPHSVASTSIAVSPSSFSVAAMSRRRFGAADQTSATVPETCGAAIEVPLIVAYSPPSQLDRTSSPGAEMFGLIPPSTAELPRLDAW